MQVDIGDGKDRKYVEHFKEMWTRSFVGFPQDPQSRATYICFTPELLGPEAFYARQFQERVGELGRGKRPLHAGSALRDDRQGMLDEAVPQNNRPVTSTVIKADDLLRCRLSRTLLSSCRKTADTRRGTGAV
jgi:hypothetical protein